MDTTVVEFLSSKQRSSQYCFAARHGEATAAADTTFAKTKSPIQHRFRGVGLQCCVQARAERLLETPRGLVMVATPSMDEFYCGKWYGIPFHLFEFLYVFPFHFVP